MALIEYPPGSGVTADYSDEERATMRAIVESAADGAATGDEVRRTLAFIHDAKVYLAATILPAPPPPVEAEQAVIHFPEPDSPFQIPGKARAKLGLPARVEDDRPAVEADVTLDRIVEPELVSDGL